MLKLRWFSLTDRLTVVDTLSDVPLLGFKE